MRIGIVELYCGKSGKKGFYNNQQIGLARAMKKRGYDSIIFYPQTDIENPIEEIEEENIRIVYLPAKVIGNHSRYDWKLLLKYGLDVVQIDSDNQIFAPDLIRFCEKHKIKVYNFIGAIGSDSDIGLKRKIMGVLFHRNLKAYKRHECFVKTHRVESGLRKKGVRDVTVAHVGLDTMIVDLITEEKSVLRQQMNLPVEKKILLFVGRMDTYKRPLEALRVLKKLSNDYMLIMIGTGSLDNQVDEEIRKSNLMTQVIRIKQLPNSDIHKYYKAVDYYLNFNEKEIFGMSILEAMYQDCTVIAIKAPGPEEIIQDGETGFLVDTTEEMYKLIADSAKIENNAAHSSIASNFIWDRTAEKFDCWIRDNEELPVV